MKLIANDIKGLMFYDFVELVVMKFFFLIKTIEWMMVKSFQFVLT